MAHELDFTTGDAAVFVTGQPAWHKLGTVVSQAQTSAEAIRLARLDWQVERRRLAAAGTDGAYTLPIADHFATVRTDSNAALGVVGSNYRVFQNAEAFDFMDALVNEKLAMYETAGSLRGGKRVWMMARIPKELRAAGNDVINPYVLLTNAHDGTSALRMVPTSVRVVCQNTLNIALGRAGSQGVSIRHCESLKSRVADARENLGIITERVDAFQEEIQALARVSMKETEVKDYFRGVFKMPKRKPAPEAGLLDSILDGTSERMNFMQELLAADKELTDRQQRANAKLLDQLMDNFHDRTNSLPGIAGSAWAAYNAVSEYVDHQRTVHGKTEREKADNRLNAIWFGSGDTIKQDAYQQALALAV